MKTTKTKNKQTFEMLPRKMLLFPLSSSFCSLMRLRGVCQFSLTAKLTHNTENQNLLTFHLSLSGG